MSKKYYAWKNRDCQGITPEWIELTGKEFVELCKANKDLPDEEKRWFYKLPPLEEGDDYLILECTKKDYLKSQVRANVNYKKKKREEPHKSKYTFCSLDYKYTDNSGEEYTLADIVGDPRVNIEDDYMNLALYAAIDLLNDDYRNFILYWIENKKDGLSDDRIAASLNISRDKLRWMYKQICDELRKNF